MSVYFEGQTKAIWKLFYITQNPNLAFTKIINTNLFESTKQN